MSTGKGQSMWDQLITISADSGTTLQHQLREGLVSAILGGKIQLNQALPSSRTLAGDLGISRNTVILTYQSLVDDGYLVSRERSGYFVNRQMLEGRVEPEPVLARSVEPSPHWSSRYKGLPSKQRNIIKPEDWRSYRYPFIYGQPDQQLFPMQQWRECCRQSLTVSDIYSSGYDRVDQDDPALIEQIQTRLLPRRGVWAKPEEILVTLGAQHALYLVASLLIDRTSQVGMENPGYPDARNIFSALRACVKSISLDRLGMQVDESLDDCDCVFVTPSHQSPTTVTMPLERRKTLLEKASESDFVIIEDDYEAEANFIGNPIPALKSLDKYDRVIYVGSLSKTLSPGLRMGYLVGPAEFIREARALRRLMLRHPPANNQRSVALFLSLGYHDSLVHRQNHVYKERWRVMRESLEKYMPETYELPTFGGSAVWIEGDPRLDATQLSVEARKQGLLIEPGEIYFQESHSPKNFFRLAYSSIDTERIEPGIRLVAELIRKQLNPN